MHKPCECSNFIIFKHTTFFNFSFHSSKQNTTTSAVHNDQQSTKYLKRSPASKHSQHTPFNTPIHQAAQHLPIKQINHSLANMNTMCAPSGPPPGFYVAVAIFGGVMVLIFCVAAIRYQMRQSTTFIPLPHKKKYAKSSGNNPDIVVVDMSCYNDSSYIPDNSKRDDGDDDPRPGNHWHGGDRGHGFGHAIGHHHNPHDHSHSHSSHHNHSSFVASDNSYSFSNDYSSSSAANYSLSSALTSSSKGTNTGPRRRHPNNPQVVDPQHKTNKQQPLTTHQQTKKILPSPSPIRMMFKTITSLVLIAALAVSQVTAQKTQQAGT
ncbi:hypothetical protein BG015_004153 [Linnemannia schmuckeri]|uniref:Uncharacterized protein n=1 Tax=Linnemannia schmuckeri TaxID=64567 RepID=A0A9P5S7H0_9FUNG|nr:hypothetical protein BG015_004153 [Linnemannia schmuckeri]